MIGCKPSETLVDPNHHFVDGNGETLIDVTQYQRLVGRLIYLTLMGPDNSYVVNVVSQFMHASAIVYLEVVYRILQYLNYGPSVGLLYTRQIGLHIKAYTDADWVGFVSDRRSTSGYCTFDGGNLVTW